MTNEIIKWGNWSIVWVDSSNISPALELAKRGEIDGLGISPHHKYISGDISFLQDTPYVQGVVLPFAENIGLDALKSIPNLRFLTVAESREPIDYSVFEKLEDLRIEWHSKIRLPPREIPLRSLYINGYKPKSRNLAEIPPYRELADIEINQGNLTSLDGIENFRNLTVASFFYLRQLQSVAALTKTKVNHLHISACKKIADLTGLHACPKLEVLRLANHSDLTSLKFLNEFKTLKEFRFIKTNVLDGDMTPLLRLKSAGFMMKRHYSHTPEQIDAMLGK